MAAGAKAVLTGDWGKLAATLSSLSVQFPAAMEAALQEEGHFYRKKIIEGITSQAPGGKAFKPLSPTTLAIRKATGFGGTKALIRTGDLRNSITVAPAGKGAIFVGVLYTARGADGRKLADIAKINEYGATIRTVLTKARLRFLRGVMRKAGRSATSPGTGEQGGVSFTRIPPRPFLQPIFDMYSGMRGAMRFQARVARKLGGMLGVLNHPDLGGRSPVTIPGRLLGGSGAKMVNKAVAGGGGKHAFSKSIRNAFKARKPSVVRIAKNPSRARVKRGSAKSKKKLPSSIRGYWATRKGRERTAARAAAKVKKPKRRQLSLNLRGAPREKLPKLPKTKNTKVKAPKVKKPRSKQLSLRFPRARKPAKPKVVKPKQLSLAGLGVAKPRKTPQPKQQLSLGLGKATRVKRAKTPKVKQQKVKQPRSKQMSLQLNPKKPPKPRVRKPKQTGFGF